MNKTQVIHYASNEGLHTLSRYLLNGRDAVIWSDGAEADTDCGRVLLVPVPGVAEIQSVSALCVRLRSVAARESGAILLHGAATSDASQLDWAAVLDSYAFETVTEILGPELAAPERALAASGPWILADEFRLRSSNDGSYGRIRKGSVKQRIAVRIDPQSNFVVKRLVSDILAENPPENPSNATVQQTTTPTPTQKASVPIIPIVESANLDPTSNLSFNLRLTDQQREMREATILPYVHTGHVNQVIVPSVVENAGGFIHYEADEYDDDEGDLDDDLAL